ncbi:hypothetical protein JXA63_03080 [Candidatus Woesebacteria bacterium]|nr:hypothetical protein [Candidatus Woesebacteria bacterium]
MAKRRTKRQKKTVKHPFLASNKISLDEVYKVSKSASKKKVVKEQSRKSASAKTISRTKSKKPMNKAEYENLRLIKRHLVKSLSLAAFILSLEIVIYLIRRG